MPSLPAIFLLCFSAAITLASGLELWRADWKGSRADSGNLLDVMLGDSRKMFANHFFVKADVYFHSGYYPTIFDNKSAHATPHISADAGAAADHNATGETFLEKPTDWIDSFGRHFYPSVHTHLDEQKQGTERELLPWLRVSAELDPNRVETYVVAAYWLRSKMNRPDEARAFLLEGLRTNPDSYEILFELGRLAEESEHDIKRARNLLDGALTAWIKKEGQKKEQDLFMYSQIMGRLSKEYEELSDLPMAIACLQKLKKVSPVPDAIQKQIDDLVVVLREKGLPAAPAK